MKFNESYTKYWKSSIKKSVDGTIIAGSQQVKEIADFLQISKKNSILDLGCSFGRMHKVLSNFGENIYGIDVDKFAVEKAKSYPYYQLKVGSAEETGFKKDLFDLVFCWAVFDVVNHHKGFYEINRILKSGGQILLTGKNDLYYSDDELAFKAEKNAYLKNFPNHFTDLRAVIKNIDTLGFKLERILLFPHRGSLGLLEYTDLEIGSDKIIESYEYLILCSKTHQPDFKDIAKITLDSRFSKTAIKKSKESGFNNVEDYFNSMGIG